MGRLIHLAGPVILAVILWRVDWASLIAAAGQARPWPLLAGLVLNLPILMIKARRWRGLSAAAGLMIPPRDALIYYLGGLYLGFITPGRLGEFYKVVYLRRACAAPLSLALGGVMADRLLDLYCLFLVGALGAAWLAPGAWSWLAGLGALALGGLGLVGLRPAWGGRLLDWAARLGGRLPGRLGAGAADLAEGLRPLLGRPLARALGETALAYGLFFLLSWLVAQGVGLGVGYLGLAGVMALTNLATFLPISVAGLGTREAALILLLGGLGVPAETALVYSLGVLAVSVLGGACLGLVGWHLAPVRISRAEAAALAAASGPEA